MRLTATVLAIAFLALQYRLWVSDGGLPTAFATANAVEAQESVNAALRARNNRLEAEVENLKRGYEAIEGRARRELGMGRDSETFVQGVPEDSSAK